MSLESVVGTLGFPIAIAVYLLWCLREDRRKCDERIDKLTERLDARDAVERKTFPRLHDASDSSPY
jgi:hypothetical protein